MKLMEIIFKRYELLPFPARTTADPGLDEKIYKPSVFSLHNERPSLPTCDR